MMGVKRVYDGDFIIHQFSVKSENGCMMVYDGCMINRSIIHQQAIET